MSKKSSMNPVPTPVEEARIARSVGKELRRINYLRQNSECLEELAKNFKFFVNHNVWLTQRDPFGEKWVVNVRTENEYGTFTYRKEIPELKNYSDSSIWKALSVQRWMEA